MLGQMVMPIIMDTSNSGPTDALVVFAAFLLSNIIMLSIYLWRTIWWFTCIRHKKKGYNYKSFYRYVIYDDNMGLIDINTFCFCIINGFALFMLGSWWIYHLLGGALPLY
jgi:hypothetical protein